MISNFKKQKQETNASARVVDGKLILSLPDALSPVVWQMDLGHAKASALEVIESKKQFNLTLKNPKGEKVEVASFTQRSQAVEGLMAASNALENAHGQINPGASAPANTSQSTATNSKTKNKKSTRGKWMSALLAIVILFILLLIWSSTVPRSINSAGFAPTTASTSGTQNSAGVPVSADDFLRGQ